MKCLQMKYTASLLALCLSITTLHGQVANDLTHRLLTSSDPEHGVWQNKTLLVNRIFIDRYHNWNKDSLIHIFLPQIERERDSLLHTVADPRQKNTIRYHYANKLFNLSNDINLTMKRDDAWKIVADAVVQSTPLPNESTLATSPLANKYLDHFVRHELAEISLQHTERGPETIAEAFRMPMDSLMSLARQYGVTSLTIPLAKQLLHPVTYEHYLAHQLMNSIAEKNLLLATHIHLKFATDSPKSPLLALCEPEFRQLQNTLLANTNHPGIIIMEKADEVTSLAELLAPFRGKVVYLDIWGTWCGPCVTEITQHTQALKAMFQHQEDLVFLYLAMEHPQHHQKWEQFIRIHEVTGVHLLKSDEEIEPIWVDLLQTTNVPRSYPTYAIFNRSGELVTASAPRPSDGEKLHQQLRDVLKQE